MEYNMESNLAHKRTFMDFLDQDIGQGVYMDKIRSMIAQGRQRLLIDLTDLRNFNYDLARRLLQTPSEYMQPFTDAVDEVTRSVDPKYFLDVEEVHIGFTGQFGFHKVTPRELLSPFLGTMISVVGIVTKCSLVRPKVVKSVHYCPTTGDFVNREYRDITANSGFPTGSVYPTRDDQGNLLVTEFGLSKYRDHQTLSIQEMPENSAPGQLPRSVDIIVEDDLVDICKPGDRVAIVGIYKAIPGKSKGSTSGVFRTVVIANNVSQLNKETNTPVFTNEDIKNIKKIGHRQDAFDLLAESLAPSIYGHSWIKKAVILQLLGGVEKNLKNGTHIRGDINVMMVGDPSVAKSQLLRAIMNIAPLAISTTGRGSSGVGLTAAVTSDQETGERRLEAGAMVLADRGVVCIDEFDKMSDLDRVSIHEVMEQQTVTIAKAGIHASLNARCSVVAAANPIYGTYDRSLTPTRNIGLPDSLLSRFDLLFIVLDQMDADIDRHISEHVLRMHRFRGPGEDGGVPVLEGSMRNTEEEEFDTATTIFVKYNRLLHGEKRTRHERRETVTIRFLKKYMHYAKSRHQPILTEEASEKIAVAYAEMRNSGSDNRTGGTLPITARTLETIIRLSAAHAKLKLQNQVTKADVDAALKVMNFAIYHKELTEMEEREQERERETERKRQADGGNDGPNDAHQDDTDANGEGRQSTRRQRRRSSGGTPGNRVDDFEPRSHTGVGNHVDEMMEGVLEMDRGNGQPMDGLQQTSIMEDVQQMDLDMDISSERVEEFNLAFAQHITATRADSLSIRVITSTVNATSRNPFSQEEITCLLQRLQAANRVMIVGDTIHIV